MGSVQIFFGSEKQNNKRRVGKSQPIEITESGGAVDWHVDDGSKSKRYNRKWFERQRKSYDA